MTEPLKQVFAARAAKDQSVFVTFITAGYPSPELTVPMMLAMEAGGADIIELGMPYSDPIADGPAIQESNNVALQHDVDISKTLDYVREARRQGLKAPVILMGYYNPVLAYDETLAVKHAREAGVNGFIIVDVPPEEAIKFRGICKDEGLSLVPLIAPSTSDARVKFLCSIADSFLYLVSRMGTTGTSTNLDEGLPNLVARISAISGSEWPIAVGFGVSTPEHYSYVGSVADGVVIGSKIVTTAKEAKNGEEAEAVRKFCESVSGGKDRKVSGKQRVAPTPTRPVENGANGHSHGQVINSTSSKVNPIVDEVITQPSAATNGAPIPGLDPIPVSTNNGSINVLPPRFGEFGGQYVPEALYECLKELEEAFISAKNDPKFWEEFRGQYGYMNRPSNLYEAKRLTEHVGGARIWFKREDLNHTGSHKINNAIGQILLARRIGKKRIIAETGAGQHGVATATACAKFGMECVVYMGAEDVRRQALNVFRMKMLGANVVAVASGSRTLKDAINEAMRDWVTNLSTTHYLIGSPIGPHPFPTIVRDFQSVIGSEIKTQLHEQIGKLPDAVVACVGGGSNAIGTFHPFIEDKSVRLIGVEAGGEGIDTPYHSATLAKGTVGVLHGVRSYILQSKTGQSMETHSISAGLDYPGVGPEHSSLKDSLRAEYTSATDEECLRGFRICTEQEGIIPALETSHAVWATVQLAKQLPKEANIVMCLSGRGDKDVEQIADMLPKKYADKLDWHIAA